MIKIILQEYEVNGPRMGNYFYLHGEVTDVGYAGWSDFVVPEPVLKVFSEELKDFAKEFVGVPELRAGWGDEVYFRVCFEKWKPTGALWVEGEIATPARSKTDCNPPCSHRFVFGFPIYPAQIDSFLTDLLELINGVRREIILESKYE
jgi:hypothetical protein